MMVTPEPTVGAPVTVRAAFLPGRNTSGRDRANREADQIARILLAGYAGTPESRWLIADRDHRLITFGVFWPAMVRYSLEHGLVDVAIDQAGAVIGAGIWFETANSGDRDAYRQALADTCREHLGRFLRYDQVLARHQPDLGQDGASWRLAWLAVAPACRGAGVGGALLRYRHAIIDVDGSAAVLTASSPRARDLFIRCGYQRRGRVFRLPGGPSMWPMLRQPRPAGSEPGGDTQPTRLPPAVAAGHDPEK